MYDHVIWPEQYDPRISPIYALNDIDVKAPPETVWKLLFDAKNWSSYFPPESQVELPEGARELALGMTYMRVTIGFKMFPVVTEFVPFSRLAWSTTVEGDETGSTAYNGWVITPTASGSHLLSEETQQGPWFLQKLGHEHPGGLFDYHQRWVEGLAAAAEKAAG